MGGHAIDCNYLKFALAMGELLLVIVCYYCYSVKMN